MGRGVDLKTWKSITPALGQTYEDCMRLWGNRLWLVYEDTRLSFKQGEEIMVALAAQLQKEFDIKKGDKVGIAMRNFPEFLLAFLGITYMGGVAVPLNSLVVQAAIKDPATGKTLKDGERGELCIKSHFNMKGYQNRPEDTAKVIDSEGFFHTGTSQ